MNRPDGGPQPRHAIEKHGQGWTDPGTQVVGGPFRQAERTEDRLVLVRRDSYTGVRPGNVDEVDFIRSPLQDALKPFEQGTLDVVTVRYTPLLADVTASLPQDVELGPAAWTAYLAFDHDHALAGNVELRRALAHAIDRDALRKACPANLVVATGGVVPPALPGHTPDIAPRFDPDRARKHLARSGADREIAVAALQEMGPMIAAITTSWERVLDLRVETRWWTWAQATQHERFDLAPIVMAGWLPGYPDPEYYLRLLLHSDSKTNEGGFVYAPFDQLIERARQERRDRERLELFHRADRMAVADRVALIPLVYGRSMAFVKPWVKGWWEFGKTSSSFADLVVLPESPRA